MDNSEIATIYIQLLRILESRFRNKAGKEFERVFRKSKDSLPFQSQEVLRKFQLSKENDSNVAEICASLPGNGTATEFRLLLIASFNQLTFLLIMAMKERYGIEYAEDGLLEMIGFLGNGELKKSDKGTTDYLKGNLDDFLNQMKISNH